MDEKQAITRKASETEAKELVEGNDGLDGDCRYCRWLVSFSR